MKKTSLAVLVAVAAVFLSGASSCDKQTETYQDAPIGTRNTATADVINMPDGYANVATKCDHGNRVYTTTTGDQQGQGGAARAVAVVPNDPTCVGGTK